MTKNPATQAHAPASAADATPAEVEAAIQSLTDADGTRLARVSDLFARKLRALGLGIEGEDLLQEAMKRTWAGKRHWKKKKVTFVKHLIETMRSIASHEPDELKGGTVVPATADDPIGGLDGTPLSSSTPDPRRATSAREQVEEICKVFDDDDEVGLVLEGLADEKTGPEIQNDLGIDETAYETIMTRLRRGLDRKSGWRL